MSFSFVPVAVSESAVTLFPLLSFTSTLTVYSPISVNFTAAAAVRLVYSVTFPEGAVNVTFVTVVSFLFGAVVASSSLSVIVTVADFCFTKSTIAPFTVV